MSAIANTISRRQWLAGVWNPPPTMSPEPVSQLAGQRVAVIQGRHCLAYRSLFCSTCVERCPVEGAIDVHEGIPQVVASVCTGCGVCHDVCPAPQNAVLMIATPKAPNP
ncbi:4Fe-4S dicluster domain-containing protein [Aeoliella sp. SH292]|uniref:4Fe-4S dicluster domain-containing protein n=1 Tax=Aeoliella sp. SH292 TaxID=3454464 RepID=UPI003F9E04B2